LKESITVLEEASIGLRPQYLHLPDAAVVARAQRGYADASEHLLYKYRNLVRAKVRSYYLVGAEREDLLQVGMIGLWQAILDYKEARATSFPAFAKVCIHRHIITAIKAASRQKQLPLNSSVPLDGSADDEGGDWSRLDSLGAAQADPQAVVLRREDHDSLGGVLQQLLSRFEWEVLHRYQEGKSYREIAAELACNAKAVDNALARIKRKATTISRDHVVALKQVLSAA